MGSTTAEVSEAPPSSSPSTSSPPNGDSQTERPSDDGLSLDELQLRAQGHTGEMPRNFSAFAAISLGFTITNSWIGYSATFWYPLQAGGGPGVFYGALVATVACFMINSGLAELASAFPSSGGQYHFAFMVSSRAWRARTAFIMGWLSVLAWVLTSASTAVVCAQMVGVIANFYHEDFVMTQWQTYLVFVLMIVLMTAYVTLLPRFMPLTEKALFWATLTGFLTMFITVLATSKTKQSASVIFKDYVNITGWSNGTSFMLAVGTCMYIYLATDAATHISEEIPNPGRNVPRAIIGTCIIGFCTVFPWMIAFLFSTNDLAAVSASLFPILEVYYQALDSHAGATFFICWLLFLYFGAGITCVATAGRLTWAFARDGGLPFSATFARIHPTQKAPVNATILAAAVQIAYGAIYVGSTAAFNTIINMAIISLNITYAIPQGIVLVRGRDKVLPKRYFDLGPYLGTLCNAFSCVWVSLYTVLFCFPTWMPAEVPSMNYLSVVLVGIVAIILAMWFLGKRKTFTGPNVTLEGVELANLLAQIHDREAAAGLRKEAEAKILKGGSADPPPGVAEVVSEKA